MYIFQIVGENVVNDPAPTQQLPEPEQNSKDCSTEKPVTVTEPVEQDAERVTLKQQIDMIRDKIDNRSGFHMTLKNLLTPRNQRYIPIIPKNKIVKPVAVTEPVEQDARDAQEQDAQEVR